MAYSKQTWTNDVSKVNATRMTHIEDGIYANSTGMETLIGTDATSTSTDGETLQLTGCIGIEEYKLKGQTSQTGTPTPTSPIAVQHVTGENKIILSTLNAEKSYKISLGTIELHGIGNNKDYIYPKNGKWYKHKEVGKAVLDGTQGTISKPSTNRFNIDNAFNDYYKAINVTSYLSNIYKTYKQQPDNASFNSLVTNESYGLDLSSGASTYVVRIKDTRYDDATQFQTWLSQNNLVIYYVLATAVEEEITYEPLIAQLNALRNSGLFNTTNITQENSNLPMILNFTADKNNISGITSWIKSRT